MDIIKLNNKPIELTTEFVDNILALLKEAHDKMDNYNASKNEPLAWHSCYWCNGTGYDGNGLDHDEDCILVKIRKVIDV